LLPDKIALVKPVFTYIQNLKNKENLKFLLLLSVFLCLIISPGAAASSGWEIVPENPVVGDIMEIRGTGFTGENAEVMVTFEKEVQVEDGSYEYLLEDVIIPGANNRFTVQAIGADDLNVRAKMLLWITKTAEAEDGIAAVSQKDIPSGTYKIRIDGKSSASSVKLKITALQEVEVDSGGNISYKYETGSIPAGNFEVKVEGSAKQVELQPGESEHSGITPSSEQNLSEGKTEEVADGISEGINEIKKISGEEKESIGNSLDLKSKKIWIAGILAGLIIVLMYIRGKKP
jgi:hypothetical protein